MYLMPFLLGEVVSVDPAGVGLGSRSLQVQTILVFVLLHLLHRKTTVNKSYKRTKPIILLIWDRTAQ
jgi:hypothetical protein